MAKFDVSDLGANKVGDIELADGVFGIEVNTQAIFDAVLRQQSSLRQGTHKVKTRAEVSGGGKKPSDKRVLVELDKVLVELFNTEVVVSHLVQHQDLIHSS